MHFMTGMDQLTVRANGIRINLWAGGTGPPVLLLHGYPQTGQMWRKVAPKLTDEFSVVYGSVAANDKEIALLTRSVLEIITDLSSYIDVPAANVEQKRTFPTPAPEVVNGVPLPGLIRIFSSPQKPDDAFASVPYGQDWYWIDDKDFPSKRLFSFIMFLFTLTDTGDRQGAPVITVPAG